LRDGVPAMSLSTVSCTEAEERQAAKLKCSSVLWLDGHIFCFALSGFGFAKALYL
jgi:hypothetical protein